MGLWHPCYRISLQAINQPTRSVSLGLSSLLGSDTAFCSPHSKWGYVVAFQLLGNTPTPCIFKALMRIRSPPAQPSPVTFHAGLSSATPLRSGKIRFGVLACTRCIHPARRERRTHPQITTTRIGSPCQLSRCGVAEPLYGPVSRLNPYPCLGVRCYFSGRCPVSTLSSATASRLRPP